MHVDVFSDLNAAIELKNESVDTVLCSDVLEHIWDHRVFWSEMARILRPGGTILLGTPFLYWLHELPDDYFRWTPSALRRACAENDLEVIELRAIGGAGEVVVDLIGKVIGLRSAALAAGVARVGSLLLGIGAIKRVSQATARLIPLTHVVVASKPAAQ